MSKMTVIQLLNKIANGEEVPKKIQVYNDIFVFDNSNCVYEHEGTRTNLLSIYNGNILDYEVRIKEEDKKIEKMIPLNNVSGASDLVALSTMQWENNLKIERKINEIIDYLEENKK